VEKIFDRFHIAFPISEKLPLLKSMVLIFFYTIIYGKYCFSLSNILLLAFLLNFIIIRFYYIQRCKFPLLQLVSINTSKYRLNNLNCNEYFFLSTQKFAIFFGGKGFHYVTSPFHNYIGNQHNNSVYFIYNKQHESTDKLNYKKKNV